MEKEYMIENIILAEQTNQMKRYIPTFQRIKREQKVATGFWIAI